jgi:hypothetical protein
MDDTVITHKPGAPSQPLLAIYDGRQCVGFVLGRGLRGYEAFDASEHSLGLFAARAEAADAVSAAARETGGAAP